MKNSPLQTPLMRQYQQVKARHPDTLLLFRMGDFFETFDEDARTTARILGITLTKRGNGAAGEVPLAGFPHHSLNTYLPKLVRAGLRVAVCEQLEDPKLAKGIVKRDVIEVVTPGVAFEDSVLERKQNNFLCAVALPPDSEGRAGCAWVDISTGEFFATEGPAPAIRDHVLGIQSTEILTSKRDQASVQGLLGKRFTGVISKLDNWVFQRDYGYELLIGHFKTKSLKGFGLEEFGPGVVAAGAVFHYINDTQRSNVPHIRTVTPIDLSDFIQLDAPTKRNLEITSTMSGEAAGSLFSVVDDTRTPMGGRLLKQWMHAPLKLPARIVERQDLVSAFLKDDGLRSAFQRTLEDIGDLERMVSRASTGRSAPRELVALREALKGIATCRARLAASGAGPLAQMAESIRDLPELVDLLGNAIVDHPPASVADGGVIRPGFRPELDDLRSLARGAKEWVAALQSTERQRTGISSLKISYNSVFGYYIEITNAHKEKVPGDYIRKQTLTNAERYITPELKEYEDKIARADERILTLETALLAQLKEAIAGRSGEIQHDARLIALLDCAAGLAGIAKKWGYCRPEVDDGTTLEIVGGRHPVIERLLPPGESYQPNDCLLDASGPQILIITGPNMSGKSSYLRQVGLIVLLAQIGSYVPASSARIGVVDRIFTRVGASDNIAEGESTFLVEMQEAANIVHAATKRSLILLDELGRGTSTFDGISIAWALSEYIHDRVGARTLFATHYHELNQLADLLERVKNVKVDVREYGEKVVFLHKVVEGYADHSYGIHVAQMAGLPGEVTRRAGEILRNLEASDLILHRSGPALPSSVDPQAQRIELKDDELRASIGNIDLNAMTPLQALQYLEELQKRFRKEENQ